MNERQCSKRPTTTRCLTRGLIVVIMFTFTEPVFELFCLLLHNFVFSNIAHIKFSGVSLGSMISFLVGLPSASLLDQYVIMMPFAFIIALFVASRSARCSVSLLYTIVQAFILLVLASLIIIMVTTHIINWQSLPVILSFILSSVYWLVSVSLTWSTLRILKIIH